MAGMFLLLKGWHGSIPAMQRKTGSIKKQNKVSALVELT
jgi:hypothetical protein